MQTIPPPTVERADDTGPAPRPVSSGRRKRALAELILLRAVPLVVLLVAWEIGARSSGAIDIPGAIGTITAFFEIVQTPELWIAVLESNQALLIGYLAAVAVGVPLGLLIGRSSTADALSRAWLSITLITPMAMLVPLIIMAIGFGVMARALVIFLFVLPMIAVNARTGVRTMQPSLTEMGRVFGASEAQLWRHVIIPSAAPSIFTGLRIGIGRAVTGMVIAEWLLAAVGIGALLLQFRGSFESDLLFAVVIVILIESLALISLVRFLEKRVVGWAG